MSKALDLKADEAAERAFAHGHTGFFRRGLVWLFSHIKGYHKTVYPHIKDEKAMQTSVKDCGVLKVDTAVADSYKVTRMPSMRASPKPWTVGTMRRSSAHL